MNEARDRLAAIGRTIDQRDQWRPIIAQEFCYLQLRVLCELIAICCLIAHTDYLTDSSMKIFEASKIIKKLSSLSSNFYPRPMIADITPDKVHLTDIETGFLTKDELIELWARSGHYVHRGTAKTLLQAGTAGFNVDLDPILFWRNKITTLLKVHLISSKTNNEHLLVFISHEQTDGKALVCIAGSPG